MTLHYEPCATSKKPTKIYTTQNVHTCYYYSEPLCASKIIIIFFFQEKKMDLSNILIMFFLCFMFCISCQRTVAFHLQRHLIHLQTPVYISFSACLNFITNLWYFRTLTLTMLLHQTLPDTGRPSGPYNLLGG